MQPPSNRQAVYIGTAPAPHPHALTLAGPRPRVWTALALRGFDSAQLTHTEEHGMYKFEVSAGYPPLLQPTHRA